MGLQCYVIQVITGKELTYLAHVRNLTRTLQISPIKLLLPQREITERRLGKEHRVIKPLFPGYIFWECEDIETAERDLLRKTPGFVRYLKDPHSGKLIPLSSTDREILGKFTSQGDIIRRSLVDFDRNNRIVVLEGPLTGAEGLITKVDRRKRRVRVRVTMNDKTFQFDLEYEQVKKQS